MKKLKLETYGEEKESPIKKLGKGLKGMWDKTVFSDMVKEKKEEKEFQRTIKTQAKLEARERAKTELKEQYVQEELNRIKGVKTKKPNDIMKKLADGFSTDRVSEQGDRISRMLGAGRDTGIGTDKISRMMSMDDKEPKEKPKAFKKKKRKKKGKRKQKVVKQEKSAYDFEDKIKRMLE